MYKLKWSIRFLKGKKESSIFFQIRCVSVPDFQSLTFPRNCLSWIRAYLLIERTSFEQIRFFFQEFTDKFAAQVRDTLLIKFQSTLI